MAGSRAGGKKSERRARADRGAAQERAAELRHEARRWFIRAVIALLVAGLASLVSVALALVFGVGAVACASRGVGTSVTAQKELDAVDAP